MAFVDNATSYTFFVTLLPHRCRSCNNFSDRGKDTDFKFTLTLWTMGVFYFFPYSVLKEQYHVICALNFQMENTTPLWSKTNKRQTKCILFYILLMSGNFYLFLNFMGRFQILLAFQKFGRSVSQSKLKQILI